MRVYPRRLTHKEFLECLSKGMNSREIGLLFKICGSRMAQVSRNLRLTMNVRTLEQAVYEYALITDGGMECNAAFDHYGNWVWNKEVERLREVLGVKTSRMLELPTGTEG